MNSIIEVENFTKKYGDFAAVNDISFEVERGSVFAFLGPNGAGKSTTINTLCTIYQQTHLSEQIFLVLTGVPLMQVLCGVSKQTTCVYILCKWSVYDWNRCHV